MQEQQKHDLVQKQEEHHLGQVADPKSSIAQNEALMNLSITPIDEAVFLAKQNRPRPDCPETLNQRHWPLTPRLKVVQDHSQMHETEEQYSNDVPNNSRYLEQ